MDLTLVGTSFVMVMDGICTYWDNDLLICRVYSEGNISPDLQADPESFVGRVRVD